LTVCVAADGTPMFDKRKKVHSKGCVIVRERGHSTTFQHWGSGAKKEWW
jgi:hypothetical protein